MQQKLAGAGAQRDEDEIAKEAAAESDAATEKEISDVSPERQKQLDFLKENNPQEYLVQLEEDKKQAAIKAAEQEKARDQEAQERVKRIQEEMDAEMERDKSE